MRPLCDVCETAAAKLFCAADEAALCISCDEKVHLCNKLANRHVRVGLAGPNDVPRCDICEKAPAFFYCEIDGTSLCLQCDMIVHVGGKRTHGRYLLFRQRVEFPGDLLPARLKDPGMQPNDPPTQTTTRRGNELNHRASTVPMMEPSIQFNGRMDIDNQRVDLNSRPNQPVEEVSITRGMGSTREGNDEAVSVVPVGSFKHP